MRDEKRRNATKGYNEILMKEQEDETLETELMRIVNIEENKIPFCRLESK
jgi:hypothetical protein